MVLANVKYDDGSGKYATNFFPVRPMFHPYDDEGGAWLVAHREEQERRFKVVLRAKPKSYDDIQAERRKSELGGSVPVNQALPGVSDTGTSVLDGFFLMRHCCVQDPLDLCSVNIVGQQLHEVKEDDLTHFENVAYMNAGENLLSIQAFRNLPALRELELPLNSLHNVQITFGDFPHLELLDVSYNNLSQNDILVIGLLPNLKILHLTGNNLRKLPPKMASPYQPSGTSDRYCRFSKLEILLLDENKLSDGATFATLAGLPKLRHLNLQRNVITGIPKLTVVDGNLIAQDIELKAVKVKNTKSKPETKVEPNGRSEIISSSANEPLSDGRMESVLGKFLHLDLDINANMDGALEWDHCSALVDNLSLGFLHSERNRNANPSLGNTPENLSSRFRDQADEVGFVPANTAEIFSSEVDTTADYLSSIHLNSDEEQSCRVKELTLVSPFSLASSVPRDVNQLTVPFPELRYLNLAHNQVREAEALLPVACWPMLLELVIHNNPLTLSCKGPPPLLQCFLRDRLGIRLVRRSQPDFTKPRIEIKPKKSRRVSSHVRRLPKVNVEDRILLAMLETAPSAPAIELPAALPPIVIDKVCDCSDSSSCCPSLSSSSSTTSESQSEHELTGENSQGIAESLKSLTELPLLDSTLPEEPLVPDVNMNQPMSKEDQPTFFLTQAGVQPEQKPSTETARTAGAMKPPRKLKKKTNLSKYKGYEILLGSSPSPDYIPAPPDLQGNVRALKHTLDHGLIYRDPRVRLEKLKMQVPAHHRTRHPPKCIARSRREEVDNMLHHLRHRTTILEERLDRVLQDPYLSRTVFPNSNALLREVQTRYDVVRFTSMKEAQEAKRILKGTVKIVEKLVDPASLKSSVINLDESKTLPSASGLKTPQ